MARYRVDLVQYQHPDVPLVTHHHTMYSEASDDYNAMMNNEPFMSGISLSTPYQIILTEIHDYGTYTIHRRDLIIP